MNTTKIKSIVMSLTLTLGSFSVCPFFMGLQAKNFNEFATQLKNQKNAESSSRTLAVIEIK